MARNRQTLLPFAHVRNRGLFSNHWFENRLPLEPEWNNAREAAIAAFDNIVELWKRERGRVELYGAEAPLEHAFIQPVLEAIGWKLIYQTHLEGRGPDYALFTSDDAKDAALAANRTSSDFWTSVDVVAEAKAWHIPLNKPTVVNNRREYPPQQIEWYLDRSRRDFGVLTNGGLWRLIPREREPHQRRFQTYLECDLAALLEAWRSASGSFTDRESLLDEFVQFYLFFGPTGHAEVPPLRPLIQRARAGSSEYRVGVGERLKDRAFAALRLCIEGFLDCSPNGLSPDNDLERCRAESFILLYRLLFIMFAEDRRFLPYRRDRNYTDNRSLGRHRDEIGRRLDEIKNEGAADFSRESTDIWEDLDSLFDLVDAGHRRYGVPEYNGGLFDAEAHAFLKQKRLSDYYLARVIDHLSRATDPLYPDAGLFRVDYRDLAIQHLGGVYEGLLELQPARAMENMVVISRRVRGRLEETYQPESEPVRRGWELTDQRSAKGSIYLKTQKGERRATGSYYTPDHIVDYIVENTLGPLCDEISTRLHREVDELKQRVDGASPAERPQLEARLAELQSTYDQRILKLRVVDPAMGSGHFLLRACQKLAEEIATHPYTSGRAAQQLGAGESELSYWKRRVVESCLYGVDLNPLAVELAKLALWLETVAADEPLFRVAVDPNLAVAKLHSLRNVVQQQPTNIGVGEWPVQDSLKLVALAPNGNRSERDRVAVRHDLLSRREKRPAQIMSVVRATSSLAAPAAEGHLAASPSEAAPGRRSVSESRLLPADSWRRQAVPAAPPPFSA